MGMLPLLLILCLGSAVGLFVVTWAVYSISSLCQAPEDRGRASKGSLSSEHREMLGVQDAEVKA